MYTVAPPSPSKKGVLVIYDVFGFRGGRVKSVCDAIAKAGFHVCLVDVYGKGRSVDDFEGGLFGDAGQAFLKRSPWERIHPLFTEGVDYLKFKGRARARARGR